MNQDLPQAPGPAMVTSRFRTRLSRAAAILLGVLAGALLWALVLGIHVSSSQPGLWALRAQRIIACGLDYNGPPYQKTGFTLWLSCGEDRGWRLWPVIR